MNEQLNILLTTIQTYRNMPEEHYKNVGNFLHPIVLKLIKKVHEYEKQMDDLKKVSELKEKYKELC